jgi:hypothetical protein
LEVLDNWFKPRVIVIAAFMPSSSIPNCLYIIIKNSSLKRVHFSLYLFREWLIHLDSLSSWLLCYVWWHGLEDPTYYFFLLASQ